MFSLTASEDNQNAGVKSTGVENAGGDYKGGKFRRTYYRQLVLVINLTNNVSYYWLELRTVFSSYTN